MWGRPGATPGPGRDRGHRGQPADRSTRRRRGKTDAIDAESAARAVLAGYAQAQAKSADGRVEMLPMFKLAKESAIKSRTQTINELQAVLVNADPSLRESLAGLNTRLVERCARLLPGTGGDALAAAKYTLRLLDAAFSTSVPRSTTSNTRSTRSWPLIEIRDQIRLFLPE